MNYQLIKKLFRELISLNSELTYFDRRVRFYRTLASPPSILPKLEDNCRFFSQRIKDKELAIKQLESHEKER